MCTFRGRGYFDTFKMLCDIYSELDFLTELKILFDSNQLFYSSGVDEPTKCVEL